MKITNTGQIFFKLRIIKVFEITTYLCVNFSSLRLKFKLKFKIMRNFKL
jgi:hypothetical protein